MRGLIGLAAAVFVGYYWGVRDCQYHVAKLALDQYIEKEKSKKEKEE